MIAPSRREIGLFLVVATAILAWSSMPTWAGYAAQTDQLEFSGSYFDPQDYAVHIAMMRAGMAGAWGYTLRFTTEPQVTAYVRMFYIVLGELNRVLKLAPADLYQATRWLFGFTALLALYMLLKRCFAGQDSRWRWLAFFIIVLGSGLGWLQRPLGWSPSQITPIDYWLIDAYFLFSLSLFPHFAFTLTLMCSAFLLYLEFLDRGGWLRICGVALAAIVVELVNPIAFFVIDVAIAAATLVVVRKPGSQPLRSWGAVAVIAAAQAPLLVYNVFVLTRLPVWSEFAAQNQTPSPPFIYSLWGFGLFWPFAAAGAVSAVRRADVVLIASLAWVIAAFWLAYAPMAIQRRFLLGITVPLGLLAARGLIDALQMLGSKRPGLSGRLPGIAMVAGFLFSITTITLSPAHAVHMFSRPAEIYYPRTLDVAFRWISSETSINDAFLSSPRTGQLIAQMTGRRVYLGHEMETIFYSEKTQQVASFYEGISPQAGTVPPGIRWVFYGPYESTLYPDFRPEPLLRSAFQSPQVVIYENASDAGP